MPPLLPSIPTKRAGALGDLPIDLPKLSVNQIFRRLPRERLQLHPLLWTPRHLDLLRCAFVDISDSPSSRDIVKPSSAPGPAPSRRPLGDISVNTNVVSPNLHNASQTPGKRLAVLHQPSRETAIHSSTSTAPNSNRYLLLARTLCRSHVVAAKEAAVAALLSENFMKMESRSCTLHFETHNVPLPCFVLVSLADAAQRESPDAVRVAYLDASKIQSAREKYLKSVCWATSDATYAMYTIRLARLTPEPGANDPYILAVLIALAQRRRLSKSAAATTPSSKVHVLLSDVKNKSHLRVYTADIPKAFLEKISRPRDRPSPAAAFQISTVSVEYEPHASFRQRLAEVLFPPNLKRTRAQESENEDRPQKRRW